MKGISVTFRIFFFAMAMLALCSRQARPATFITATVTVTNAPTVNGNAATISGTTHTFTNNITANPAIFVSTNASIGGSATNLFKHLAMYPVSAKSLVRMSGTNAVVIEGGADEAITASISSGWATLTLSTNGSTNTYAFRVPNENTSYGTNVVNLAAQDLGEKSAYAIAATAALMGNFVNTSTAQTIGGAKNFTAAVTLTNASSIFANGMISNVFMTNMQSLGVTNAFIANLQAAGFTLSNTAPLMLFQETDGALNEKYTFLQSSTVGGVAGVRLTYFNDALSSGGLHLRFTRTGNTPLLAEIFSPLQVTMLQNSISSNVFNTNSTAGFTSGTSSGVAHTNSTYAGNLVKMSGGYLDGSGATNLTTTNSIFTGNNTVTGDLRFTRANNTALTAGGNAAVDLGTKVVVKLKAGPAGTFSIDGIANGADGKWHKVINATGQDCVIKNESGTDPTPANRIKTNTGGDVTITGYGAFEVWYDSEDSRWVLMSTAP